MGILKKHFKKQIDRYRDNKEGATAVEFAILFVPFGAMLFAIIELGIVFFIQATLGNAMQEAARDIRTGEFQSAGGAADAFQAAVCEGMAGLGSCDNLRIDVVTSSTGRFQTMMLPDTPKSDPDDPDAQPPLLPNDYTDTAGRDVVVVRAQYFHKLAFPGEYTRLANAAGNTRIISTVTAFRNEPF